MNEFEDQIQEESEDTMEGKFLIFAIGDEDYGISIRNVTEIIGIQGVTELPDTPDFVKGVINLRGKVIPVIDVRLRFMIEEREYDDRTCIIVVNIDEVTVGLIVDSVAEVQDIPKDNIEPPPNIRSSSGSHFIQGLGKISKEVKILLNIHKLLFDDELEQIAEAMKS